MTLHTPYHVQQTIQSAEESLYAAIRRRDNQAVLQHYDTILKTLATHMVEHKHLGGSYDIWLDEYARFQTNPKKVFQDYFGNNCTCDEPEQPLYTVKTLWGATSTSQLTAMKSADLRAYSLIKRGLEVIDRGIQIKQTITTIPAHFNFKGDWVEEKQHSEIVYQAWVTYWELLSEDE